MTPLRRRPSVCSQPWASIRELASIDRECSAGRRLRTLPRRGVPAPVPLSDESTGPVRRTCVPSSVSRLRHPANPADPLSACSTVRVPSARRKSFPACSVLATASACCRPSSVERSRIADAVLVRLNRLIVTAACREWRVSCTALLPLPVRKSSVVRLRSSRCHCRVALTACLP